MWTSRHALNDGESAPMFLNQIASVYKNRSSTPDVPFATFVRYAHNLDSKSPENYWRSVFDTISIPFPVLPNPKYRLNLKSLCLRTIFITRKEGSPITNATIFRAAIALTISHTAGIKDVIFGETLWGRDASMPEEMLQLHPLLK